VSIAPEPGESSLGAAFVLSLRAMIQSSSLEDGSEPGMASV
jgi:hypothetical protein